MSPLDDMRLRTPEDIGALIRQRGRDLGLSQLELAARAGVSRQWVVDVEAGKPRAELGLVPLVQHGHRVVDAFVWGLLPDNELILDRWAKRFQVSARSAFALIAHVGEDCAGAIRFVVPERLASATPRTSRRLPTMLRPKRSRYKPIFASPKPHI